MEKNKNSPKNIIYIITENSSLEEKIKRLFSEEEIELHFLQEISSVYKLKDIMKQLRGKNGCPWDKEQDHRSLLPYLTEEAYEVVAAIEENNPDKICEELGDLLLQIVFHCQIADEKRNFSLEKVAKGIVEKLIRRHPHIFSTVTVTGSDEVIKNWEEIKKKEKGVPKKSLLDDICENLPALVTADLITKKAAKASFDWKGWEDVMLKLQEEIEELKCALKGKDFSQIREEIGDILFTIVNLARHLDVDPEYALKLTSKKFIRRFKKIEELIRHEEDGQPMEKRTLEELDELWEAAKKEDKDETGQIS